MRPLQLTMTAFGPFAEAESIDFTRFGTSALFLINGPTGAGKTTILDAICFALYGKTTGDEREGHQMRCDHAAPETLCEVILTFELGERRYRVRRVPEQERPKARGAGTTTQAAEAQLWELAKDGERLLVGSKVTDATREIEERTGLSVDQFRQVMVLPQGKFRELLLAESKEREQIFSRLFQTGIYKKLEDYLKEQAATIRQEAEKFRQQRAGMLSVAGVESSEALQLELEELTPRASAAGQLKTEKEAVWVVAGKAQQHGRILQQSFADLERSQTQQAALVAQQLEITARRQELATAELAQRLTPVVTETLRCARDEQQTSEKQAQAATGRDAAQLRLATAETELNSTQAQVAELDSAKAEGLRLEGYRERAVQLAAARTAFSKAESVAASAQAAQAQGEAALAASSAKLGEAEAEQRQLHTRQPRLAECQLQLQSLTEQLGRQQEFDQLQKQLEGFRQDLTQREQQGKRLREEYEDRQEQAKRLELAWHQGQAALLALELLTGQPCPVCGGLDHPAPAHSAEAIPSSEALEQARNRTEEANRQLATARETYSASKAKLEQTETQAELLLAKLGTDATQKSGELEARRRALLVELDQLLAEQRRLTALNLDLQQQKAAESSARADLEQIRQQLSAATAALATARAQTQGAEQELPEVWRETGSLEEAITTARGRVASLEQQISRAREAFQLAQNQREGAEATLRAANEALAAAQKTHSAALEAQSAALAASPFTTLADYSAALRDETQTQRLQNELSEHDAQCQRVAGALAQQQAALAGQTRPDLTVLDAALELATTEKAQAEVAWQQLDQRLQQLRQTAAQLERAGSAQSALDERYRLIGTLSDVANGQTGDKLSLQRFVLSVLLDDVLIEASRRLSLMSKGRYQLLRKEDRSKGNKASGLELEVEDAYTGKVRPVATLSGGESFMAALALALGLSEVVQAYAGGMRLDTLFIDEGFGSLDSESLDLAIRTLVDLQAAGRMIGVISHVAELKEQLPLRLDVLAGRNGSSVRLVAP